MLHAEALEDPCINLMSEEISLMMRMGVPLYAVTEFLDFANNQNSMLPKGHPNMVIHMDPLLFRDSYMPYFN